MKYSEPTPAELTWIREQVAVARALTGADVADDVLPSLRALDEAFAAALAAPATGAAEANRVINAVGIAFGAHLVANTAFDWSIATDASGSDMALVALPGTADVTVFPANFVAKRWESGQTGFLEVSAAKLASDLDAVAQIYGSAERKKPWWRFWQ